MPLGVTLSALRRELRAEAGMSLNPAQGVQAQQSLDIVLERQQRELWDAYNWPHLKLWTDMELEGLQDTYDYPKEMKFDQVSRLYVATISRDDPADPTKITGSSAWRPLVYGIKAHMMGLGAPEVGTPLRWRNVAVVDVTGDSPITNPVGQFQLLPMPPDMTATPNTGLMLRVEGQAPLSPLVTDTDACIIDSKAIVLFAAAEVMAVQKSEGAPMKLTKAQNYLRRLLQDQGADKRQNYNMGGVFRGGIDPDKGGRRSTYAGTFQG